MEIFLSKRCRSSAKPLISLEARLRNLLVLNSSGDFFCSHFICFLGFNKNKITKTVNGKATGGLVQQGIANAKRQTQLTMTEIELNKNDKLRLRADIKISMVLGLLFSLALVIIVGLIPGVMFIFGKRPSDGFVTRGLYIIGL